MVRKIIKKKDGTKNPKKLTKKQLTDKRKQNKVKKAEQSKRLKNMERDMEKYALVVFDKNHAFVEFSLVNIKDGKLRKFKVKSNGDVICNCFDWKIRCKKAGISCKHILYVLTQILKIDPSIAANNKVKKRKQFEASFTNIKINYGNNAEIFQVKEDRELTAEDLCPICYVDFMSDEKTNIINCLKCKGVVHRDCMECWLNNACNKSCVYCRDPGIKKLIGR